SLNNDPETGNWSVSGRTVTLDDELSFTYTMSGNTFTTTIEDFEIEEGEEEDVTFVFAKQ
ncbi:hypothetical protein ACFL4T_10670, partial [candidate division KSB1 bacterium]